MKNHFKYFTVPTIALFCIIAHADDSVNPTITLNKDIIILPPSLSLELWSSAILPPIPAFPSIARRSKSHGILAITFTIDKTGTPQQVSVANSKQNLIGPLCTTATAWLRRIRFQINTANFDHNKANTVYVQYKLPNLFGASPNIDSIKLLPIEKQESDWYSNHYKQ